VGTNKFSLTYICRFPKPTHILYVWGWLDLSPTNIYDAQFDFDQPRRFVGEAISPMNMRGLYSSVMWYYRRI
jgi:hypothetical protein